MQLKKYNCFIIPYTVFLVIAMVILSMTNKGEFELWLNSYHSNLFDFIFKYATWIGDGIFFFIVIVVLLFYRISFGLIAACSGITVSLISVLCKQVFFQNAPRPLTLLQNQMNIHLVDGVVPLYQNSFPSGHTMSAFALFFMLTLLFKNRIAGTCFFAIAFLVGLSRMYLMQHFLLDVFAGSVMGVIISSVWFYFFAPKLFSIEKLNRPLIRK